MQLSMLLEIKDEDIAYAEEILFKKTGVFDDERIDFIKEFQTTLDLKAVPGSGKTTALLAKLLILERYLPLSDGAGVLVLSHTNTAIDEIKGKIGRYCPKLFSYPNFIGTIQSFVDEFLAIPYFLNCKHTRPIKIDQDIYLDRFNRTIPRNFKIGLEGSLPGTYESFLSRITVSTGRQLIYFDSLESASIGRTSNTTQMYQQVVKTKLELLNTGFLNFNDAYYLANRYLDINPRVVKIIRNRFKFVFVDEMQDMESHQYKLLERLFFCEEVTYQRVGDKNQAVFGGNRQGQEAWEDRETIKILRGSYRLPSNIAAIVNDFCIDTDFNIDGRREGEIITPCIIVFSNDSIDSVLPAFTDLVVKKITPETIAKSTESNHRIKMIGWVKEKKSEDKLGINSYFKAYNPEILRNKVFYKTLKSHLVYSKETQSPFLGKIRKSLIEAFITILRKEEVKVNEKFLTEKSLDQFLREKDREFYDDFKLNIYRWSLSIYKGEENETYESIKNYIPIFLAFFATSINHAREFIEQSTVAPMDDEASSQENVYNCPITGLNVEIGTVHSVKGETHLATLYVETFYQRKHESQRLKDSFCGVDNIQFTAERDKEAAKMAYVAMSRPTHLLCFAMHQDRYNAMRENLNDRWEIVMLD